MLWIIHDLQMTGPASFFPENLPDFLSKLFVFIIEFIILPAFRRTLNKSLKIKRVFGCIFSNREPLKPLLAHVWEWLDRVFHRFCTNNVEKFGAGVKSLPEKGFSAGRQKKPYPCRLFLVLTFPTLYLKAETR